MILWMGIGSADFTRRSESSTRNVFELMQRPQRYNARAGAGRRSAPRFATKGDALMFPTREDLLRLLPELILCLTGILLMLVEPFLDARAPHDAALRLPRRGAALALRGHASIRRCIPAPAFSGLLRIDRLQRFRPRGGRTRWRCW